MSFASAGFFSDIFGKITGGVTSGDCILDNPLDFDGNKILVSEHYFGVGNYENYAGKYCEIVWGCTGFKDVTILDDNVKACRCEVDSSFGCDGDSCVNDVSATTYWERVASVTCTGCPTDCSGSAEPICGDGNIDAGEECDDGNIIDDCVCLSDCVNPSCGDNLICGIEECDDGNTHTGDGCSSSCTNEVIVDCGDGTCDSGLRENCVTCASDCGVCTCEICVADVAIAWCTAGVGSCVVASEAEQTVCENLGGFFAPLHYQCPSTIPTTECIDSDGGWNIYLKGNIDSISPDTCAFNSEADTIEGIYNCSGEYPNCYLIETSCDQKNDSSIIYEFSFQDRNAFGFHVNCPNGCLDGACVCVESAECPEGNECVDGACVGEPTGECTDSDGDLSLDEQYYVHGTASLGDSSSEDVCDGKEIVQEFYCSEDGINNEYYKCPNGCDGGACIEIPKGGECTMGCYLDEKCYNIGVRKSGDYCGEDLDFEKQKEPDTSCGDNFECLSNICIDGACIQASLWKRFLALIRGEIVWSDIFGGGDDKNLIADDLVLTFETGDEYALILLDYREENLDETDEYSTGFFLDLEDGYGFSEILKTVLRDSLPLEGLLLQISGIDTNDTKYTIRAIMDTKEEIKESDEEDNCIQQSFTIVRDDTGNVAGFKFEGPESCIEEEQSPITGECTDNDSGFDPYIYGVMKRKGVAFDYVDMCYPADSTHLHEWVCDSSVSDPLIVAIHEYYPDGGYWVEVDCPNGCLNGACILEEPIATCTDDDGGVDGDQYYVKGIANDEANSFEDGCISAPNYQVDNEGNIDPGKYQAVVDCIGLDCFLFEGICKDLGIAGATYYNCLYGCKEGACVTEKPIEKPIAPVITE